MVAFSILERQLEWGDLLPCRDNGREHVRLLTASFGCIPVTRCQTPKNSAVESVSAQN
jgi:hypothetical protein